MKKQKLILKDLITESWALFLDRDGVINRRIPGDYVAHWEQFQFLDGVTESINLFAKVFSKIFVITNQQGIGKGLMNETDLLKIHAQMIAEIENSGGRIDKIYFCPYLKEANHIDRKPNIGMGLRARKDFPEINFKKSVMVGDSITDMEFGARLGMINVYISQEMVLPQTKIHIHFMYPSLFAFANEFKL